MIEEARVHPLTALTTLSDSEKHRLLENNYVLCKSVQHEHVLQEFGIKPANIPRVLEEAKFLCSPLASVHPSKYTSSLSSAPDTLPSGV